MIRFPRVLTVLLLCVSVAAHSQSPASPTSATSNKTKAKHKTQEQQLLEQLNERFNQVEDLTEQVRQLRQEVDDLKKQVGTHDAELQQTQSAASAARDGAKVIAGGTNLVDLLKYDV